MTDTPQAANPPPPFQPQRRKSVARASKRENRLVQRAIRTQDSFANLPARIGDGTDNQATFGTYAFNPITRLRIVLDFAFRGSWICRKAVKSIPEDLFREGIELGSELSPDDRQLIYSAYSRKFAIAKRLSEAMIWGRLYGGAIAVMMIDGQDPSTPFRLETVAKGQFCGLAVYDRWMLNPSLNDLVSDMKATDIGKPKYYDVVADAPIYPRKRIHHSRVVRFDGDELSYYQRLSENLWSMSVLEPVFDRIKAFDAATLGTAQLVYRAHMRVLKLPGWREVVGTGGPMLDAALAQIDWMRRFQGNEGITVVDGDDTFESLQYSFTGLDAVLVQMGQQLAGAIDTPLVRLFGQAPAGLNSTGESDWRMYYDSLKSLQEDDVRPPLEIILRVIARSEGVELPAGFNFSFLPLWQMTPEVKASVSSSVTSSVVQAHESGIIGQKTALKELKQSSHETGIWTNITEEEIDSASDEPPAPELGGEPPAPRPEAAPRPELPTSAGASPEGPREDRALPGGVPVRRSFLPGQPRLRVVGGGREDSSGAFSSPELERGERRTHRPLLDPYGPGRALHIHDAFEEGKHPRGKAGQFTSKGERIPPVLHHYAHKQNMKAILEKGLHARPDEILEPDNRPGVNLASPRESENYNFLGERGHRFKVNTAGLDPQKFEHLGSGWWRYMGHIHPEHLEPARGATTIDRDLPGRRTRVAGHDVIVEVEAGQPRHEGSSGGAVMAAPYGYFPGTVGHDGDSVDVFLGPNPEAGKAYVIGQQEPDPPHRFHQHKVFIGYDDPAMVTDHFLKFYADGRGRQRLRSGTVMSMSEFAKWLERYRSRAA